MGDRWELWIQGGTDKTGAPEPVPEVRLGPGEVLALVGATGSGKTRLLADIERLTTGDSPTARCVTLEGLDGPASVARISQSMGFFLDATVGEFLVLHAKSRGRDDLDALQLEALTQANRICGEGFTLDTPLAHLSGGQARALMVADTVLISRCPVVLIDEIENAGIDRREALAFLLSRDVAAVVATHDPLIALGASRRLVMAGGAMSALLDRSAGEEGLRTRLDAEEDQRSALRERLRTGQPLEDPAGTP
jgi:ABC-type lipoprotein export system ATPase subunit